MYGFVRRTYSNTLSISLCPYKELVVPYMFHVIYVCHPHGVLYKLYLFPCLHAENEHWPSGVFQGLRTEKQDEEPSAIEGYVISLVVGNTSRMVHACTHMYTPTVASSAAQQLLLMRYWSCHPDSVYLSPFSSLFTAARYSCQQETDYSSLLAI